MIYTVIHIKGKLDTSWADWFEDMQIGYLESETVLSGDLPDKSGVYGVISRLSSLGVALVSVHCQEKPEC